MISPRVVSLIVTILCVTTLIGGLFTYRYYEDQKEKERNWERFINHFYVSLNRSYTGMDRLIANRYEGERLEVAIENIEQHLIQTQVILESGSAFYNGSIHSNTNFFYEMTELLDGIEAGEKIKERFPPIDEDGRISERELQVLTVIRNRLKLGRDALYSEETGQEDPDLTVGDVNQVIIDHYDLRSSTAVYKKAHLAP